MSIEGYGPVNPLETTARYTTVAAVKRAIGIDSAEWDTEVLQAIVSMEYLIDAYMEHSLPDPADPDVGTDDALVPPPIEGIPEAVKQAALDGTLAVFKATDTPFGTAGSDDFIGAVDFDTRRQRALNQVKPMLLGFKLGWGLN